MKNIDTISNFSNIILKNNNVSMKLLSTNLWKTIKNLKVNKKPMINQSKEYIPCLTLYQNLTTEWNKWESLLVIFFAWLMLNIKVKSIKDSSLKSLTNLNLKFKKILFNNFFMPSIQISMEFLIKMNIYSFCVHMEDLIIKRHIVSKKKLWKNLLLNWRKRT